jgi:hypothetical protein
MRNASYAHEHSAATAGAPTFEQLEKRQMLSAVVNSAKIKNRYVSENGVMTNHSVLTIPLTEKVNIADASKIQVRGFAYDPLDPTLVRQKKIVINVVEAKVLDLGQDYGLIELTLDRMMRMGGSIFFYAGSLTHQSDGSAVPEQLDPKSPKGLTKDRFTLACRAFLPNDVNLFSNTIFTGASAATVADQAVPEGTVTADLDAFLQKKVDKGIITIQDKVNALATYNDATNRLRIPDHNLRAALVSLTGTAAANAINVYLGTANVTGKPYTIIDFADTSEAAIIAQTRVTSANRLETIIKPTFQGEHFAALSAILAHEAMHQDNTFTIQEETVANIVQDVTWNEQINADTSIVNEGTSLVKFLNTQQLALLNSGRSIFPVTGVLQAPILNTSRGVFPFGKTIPGGNYTSYNDYIQRQYVARGGISGTSPGNPTLEEYVTHFPGVSPAGDFSDALIAKLDGALYQTIPNLNAIAAAGALKLSIF